jgi:hypothetical protein
MLKDGRPRGRPSVWAGDNPTAYSMKHLLGQCRYAKIGPYRVGRDAVVMGFERSSRQKRASTNVNGVPDVRFGVVFGPDAADGSTCLSC